MIPALNTFSVLFVFFFVQFCLSADVGVQVDLIFPRNNSVYQPVFPFPLAFAIHNFSTAWQYKPLLAWRLTRLDPSAQAKTFGASGAIGWDATRGDSSWGAPSDKFLAINSTDAISYDNESNWRLEYRFTLGEDDCFSNFPSRIKSHGSSGVILFNTSNITGILPDIAAPGPCPLPLGAVGFAGQNQTNATCPQLASPRADPVSCAFTVTKEMSDQVAKQMLAESKCDNTTWPSGTGIGQRCNTSTLKHKSDGAVLRRSLLTMAVPIVLGLWSIWN
jgi:hypothetical protein